MALQIRCRFPQHSLLLLNILLFCRMISIESWRIAIGNVGNGIKSKMTGCSRPPEDHKCVVEDGDSPQFNMFRLFLVCLALILFFSSSASQSHPLGQQIDGREALDTILSKKEIQLLLQIAGVEINPGPHHQYHSQHNRPICEECGQSFARLYNMKKHQERFHQGQTHIICRLCKQPFERLEDWEEHMLSVHKPRSIRWQLSKQAFLGKVKELTFLYSEKRLERALGKVIENSAYKQVIWHKRLHGSIKFQFTFVALMKKTGALMDILESLFFHTDTVRLLSGELSVKKQVAELFKSLQEQVLEMSAEQEGSGWTYVQSEALIIKIVGMKNKAMGSYIPFKPRSLRGNALRTPFANTINVRNEQDNLCALYCIILAKFGQHIQGDLTNPSNLKEYLALIDYHGVNFPVQENDLERLEDNNKDSLNISIFVWKYLSPQRIQPFYLSRVKRRGATECHMLLIERAETETTEGIEHLIHIVDPNALFRETLGPGKGQQRKHFFCPSCKHFKSESVQKMSRHFKQCTDPHYFHKKYPPHASHYIPDGNLLAPPNSYRTEPPVLRAFADFETLHQKVEEDGCEKCLKTLRKLGCDKTVSVKCKHQRKTKTKTINCTELPAICFSLIVVDSSGKTVFKKYYRGTDAAEKFIEVILSKEKAMMEYIERYVSLTMSEADQIKFESATHCQECEEEFETLSDRVRDHNHFTGGVQNSLIFYALKYHIFRRISRCSL